MRLRLPTVPPAPYKRVTLTPEDRETLAEHERPVNRPDCLPGGHNEERPCPWAGCRYHLGIYVNPVGGLREMVGWQDDGKPTCALDVADEGSHGLEEVGNLFGVTREMTRLIEERALWKMRKADFDWPPEPEPVYPLPATRDLG